MNTLSAVLLIALILSLALNGFQFVRFYEVRSALDDSIEAIQRKDRMISECRAGINRLHIINRQREIDALQKEIEMILSARKEDGE